MENETVSKQEEQHAPKEASSPFEVVILAGGMGSRLAPITDELPKPLVPVCGVPTLTRLTETLRQNGWEQALLTTCALPEAFDAYRDPNLRLKTVKGSVPRGSAGCVRAVKDQLAETFLVVSGDTVTDFDLRYAFEQHRKEHRLATLLLTRTDAPGEFGIVSLDGGRIVGFSEKPSWRDTFSDLVSTGIYVLDRSLLDSVPEGVSFDFGRDLFPLLLRKGIELCGEVMSGHWWDIGTPQSYYRCCMALSDGETVRGNECVVAGSAQVHRSILHDRVTIGDGALVEGSILCSGVRVGRDCVIPSGCVVGQNTVLEDGARLTPGVRLKGGLTVGKDASVGDRFVFGSISRRWFGDERIRGDRSELDSSFCLRLGRALKTPGKPLKVGILHGASAGAALYAELLARGVQDAGGQVWELGDGFPGVISFAVRQYDLDLAVFLDMQESVNRVSIWFCDRDGLPLSREAQRAIESRLTGEKFDVCVTPQPAVCPDREERVLCRYCQWLQEQVGSLSGVRFCVTRRDDAGEFLYANAKELGAEVSYGEERDNFTVSPDGYRACAYTASGKPLTYWHLVAIAAAESDEPVVCLPVRVPHTVQEYLQKMGKELRFYSDAADDARAAAARSPYVQDGVLLCLLVAKRLQQRGVGLDEALAALPAFFVCKKELPVVSETEAADRRASRIASLSDRGSFPARVFRPTGCVTVFPNAAGGYTILAEASGWEAAEELCAEMEDLL